MTSGRRSADLIEQIYASALEPGAWDDAMRDVAKTLDADAAYVYLPGRAHGPDDFARDAVGWNVLGIEAATQIARDTGRRDAFVEGATAKSLLKPGAIGFSQDFVDDRRWDENPWSELAYKVIDVRHCMGFISTMPAEANDLMHFSLFRRSRAKPFTTRHLERFDRFRPHLERAARMTFRIRSEVARSERLRILSDARAEPVAVVDSGGRVVNANSAAQAMLREGRRLVVRRGRIEPGDVSTTDALLKAVYAAVRLSGSDIWLRDKAGRRFFCAVSPIALGGGVHGALLFVEPEPAPSIKSRLCALCKLTDTEAEVALGIGEGRSVSEIAQSRGVTIGTVRVQMRAIFAKTETDTQAQLAILVGRLSRFAP